MPPVVENSFDVQEEAIDKAFPYTWDIIKQSRKQNDGRSVLDIKLLELLRNFKSDNLFIDVDGYAKKPGLVCVFALSDEAVYVNQFAGKEQLLIELTGLIVIFDWEAKKLITSLPVSFEKTYVPDEDTRSNLVFKQHTDSEGGLLGYMVEALAKDVFLPSKSNRAKSVGVGKVELENPALVDDAGSPILPLKYQTELGQEEFKSFVANRFLSYLSSNQSVSVVPYSSRENTNGKREIGLLPNGADMALRMETGSSKLLTLEIPEGNYLVDITVRRFLAQTTLEKPAEKHVDHATFIALRAYLPDNQSVGIEYFNEKIYNNYPMIVANGSSYSKWDVYRNLLLSLLAQFSQQLEEPERKWCKEHGNKDLRSNMKIFTKKIIESCHNKNYF